MIYKKKTKKKKVNKISRRRKLKVIKRDGRVVDYNKDKILIAIEKANNEVIDENPNQLATYKSGKTNILGFFVGQVLKKSGGKANPSIVNKIVNEEINKR